MLLLVVVADQAAAGDGRDEREREKVLETQVNESCCSRREEREREREREDHIDHSPAGDAPGPKLLVVVVLSTVAVAASILSLSPDSFGVDALSLLL